jgi:protein-tyrosine-phosphatase
MAEGLMRHKCKEEGRNDMTVSSMGIHGLNDYSATEYAQKVCENDGFDISSHKARYLVGDELQMADLIWLHKKVFLLGAWPEKQTRKSAIKDPMGGSYEKYQEIYSLIKTHIERIFPLL